MTKGDHSEKVAQFWGTLKGQKCRAPVRKEYLHFLCSRKAIVTHNGPVILTRISDPCTKTENQVETITSDNIKTCAIWHKGWSSGCTLLTSSSSVDSANPGTCSYWLRRIDAHRLREYYYRIIPASQLILIFLILKESIEFSCSQFIKSSLKHHFDKPNAYFLPFYVYCRDRVSQLFI